MTRVLDALSLIVVAATAITATMPRRTTTTTPPTRTSTATIDNDTAEAYRYMRIYGFLDNEENQQSLSLPSDNATSLNNAISLFQEFYGLPGNGILTSDTMRFIRTPRCGVKDIPARAYSPLMLKWPKTHLTWNFKLANKDLLYTTQAAFALWSEHSSLTFSRDRLRPDILISYRSGLHTFENSENGDVCPSAFAGPGASVAHAFYPSGRADHVSEIHVDESESWHITLTRPPSNTLYLFHVLTHEIGHALGLSHSLREDSVMYAIMPESDKQYPSQLSIEDVVNIQKLYGSRDTSTSTITDATSSTTTTPTTTTTTTASAPTTSAPTKSTDLCALKRIDGALIVNHRLYIARKRDIWPIDMSDKRYGQPFSFADYFTFLPANLTRISAMYQRASGDVMIFANDSVYLTDANFRLKDGWPRAVETIGFPRNAKINAAINTHTGRSYVVYNDDKIAEMNDCSTTTVKHGALRDAFPGIPPAITTAFRYADGNLYFLKKRDFYAYSEFTDTLISAGPFDLRILGIECPAEGIFQQMRELVSRIYRLQYYASLNESNGDDDDDDDDDDGDNSR